MSGLQKFSLVLLSLTTAGVFLFVGWLTFGDEISSRLAPNASDAATAGPDITIWAVGDSLMVAATGDLQAESSDIVINAEVGRRMDQGLDVLTEMFEQGTPDVLVIALGTNNGVTVDQVDEVMDLASDVDKVVFVNVSVPRPWEGPTNTAIMNAVDLYPAATLVDWKSESRGAIDLFRSDGFHLSQEGTQLWVGLIMDEAAR
jgi:lysophospholipase L1-like esterase